eukprot:Skav215047  [mRNA]  locus=scaffold2053:94299:105489:- [translate_table: standard]
MNQVRSAAPGIQFINVGYKSPGYCNSKTAIFMHNNLNGCVADIGMWSSMRVLASGRNQDLNLGAPCRTCGVATHELLHSLGMAHEQQRPDRDRHITVLEHNIRPGKESQFYTRSGADTSQRYDIKSLMHYGAYAFSKAPGQLPTMVAKNTRNSKDLGQKVMMSTADKNQLRALYGCKAPNFDSCSPSSGSSWIFIGIGAAVVVLGGGGGAAMMMAKKSPAQRPYERHLVPDGP